MTLMIHYFYLIYYLNDIGTELGGHFWDAVLGDDITKKTDAISSTGFFIHFILHDTTT